MKSRQELEGYDAMFLAKMCSTIGNNPSVDPATSEKALQLKQDWFLLYANEPGWDLDQISVFRLAVEVLKRRMVDFLTTHG